MVGSEPRDRELERRPGEEMEEGEEVKEAVPSDAEKASCYSGGGVAVAFYCRRHRDSGGGKLAVHWVPLFNKPCLLRARSRSSIPYEIDNSRC
ncbi:unnamed protein product [Urochloa humidicola]